MQKAATAKQPSGGERNFACNFSSLPINEQNLSDWKKGGFRDWQRQQEACDHVRGLIDHAATLENAADGRNIPALLTSLFMAELAANFSPCSQ